MMSLTVFAGSVARQRLAAEGWHPDLFDTLLGASGGPKWLVLSAMDRVLHKHLLAGRTRPLDMIASSIGSWRHACLTQVDAGAALDRFEDAYIEQRYSDQPTTAEVSAVASEILSAAIGERGPAEVIAHPLLHNHIVTARARGIARGTSRLAIGAGMGAAAVLNALHRPWLASCFSRVVFSHPDSALPQMLQGFSVEQIALATNGVVSALKASGAIPLVLEPERDIAGAPPGLYWDGGIIDYHFEPAASVPGLVLYPHFTDTLTAGWFDKFLPWRAGKTRYAESLVLICPSREFVAALPYGRIPDRRDFQRLAPDERRHYWRQCLAATEVLAEQLQALLQGSDPLAGVRCFPDSSE